MIPNMIELSGKVYIKYAEPMVGPRIGDIKLLLNDDSTSCYKGNYDNLKLSGYIKAKIFDGVIWQNVNIGELCTAKEYKFTKRQKAIDSALLCQAIIAGLSGAILYKTYRGHFSTK